MDGLGKVRKCNAFSLDQNFILKKVGYKKHKFLAAALFLTCLYSLVGFQISVGRHKLMWKLIQIEILH